MTQILRRFSAVMERMEDERKIGRILEETGTVAAGPVAKVTLGGDERRLRGIPAVARGVSGASPGTDPRSLRFVDLMR